MYTKRCYRVNRKQNERRKLFEINIWVRLFVMGRWFSVVRLYFGSQFLRSFVFFFGDKSLLFTKSCQTSMIGGFNLPPEIDFGSHRFMALGNSVVANIVFTFYHIRCERSNKSTISCVCNVVIRYIAHLLYSYWWWWWWWSSSSSSTSFLFKYCLRQAKFYDETEICLVCEKTIQHLYRHYKQVTKLNSKIVVCTWE